MKKIYVILGALLFSVLFLTGCASEKEMPNTLTVGILPDTDSLPFVIAQERGYFSEEGLAVDLQMYHSAMERDSALQSGNVDFVISDILAAAFAKAGGFDVKIVAATDGAYRLVTNADFQASNVQDLAGMDVAVSKNTIIEYVTDQILAKEAMTTDSINKVIIPQIPARLEMLQKGKLTAATLPEPMASVAVSSGCHVLTDSEALGINPGIMMAKGEVLAEKKDAILALYRAYNKATAYLKEAPREEYIALAIEKCGFPPSSAKYINMPLYHEARLPEAEDIEGCLRWLMDRGLITETFSYDDMVADVLK